ncbi:MAG: hypothetical protein HYZ27_11235 [Deltaproteobacteria bacterium]|nr:hypothetical protein [Deltaproteobacteria bacterium]
MAGDDEDRPKKSWREIDAQRDKSTHQREDRAGGAKPARIERSQAYRSYKTQLDKLFSGGALPEALKEKLTDGKIAAQAKERKAAAEAILAAASPKAVEAALAAYQSQHGFPEDEQVLARLLDLSNDAVLQQAIATIARLHGESRLKRAQSLKARLNTVAMTAEDPAVQNAARALVALL